MHAAWERFTSRVDIGADEDALFAPPAPAPRTQLETVEDLLEQSRRGSVPIRRTFIQSGRGPDTRPGPLGQLVRAGDERGLDMYLLLHAVASAAPWDCTYPAHTWVRAMGLGAAADERSAKAAVSKTLARLAKKNLIEVTRSRRLARVTLLDESGSGAPYHRPRTKEEPWFKLRYDYWSSRYNEKLELPAKAVLLIALSSPDAFSIPLQHAPAWFGIGAKTAQRGLAQLTDLKIVRRWSRYQADPSTVTGWVRMHRYALNPPLARDGSPRGGLK